MLILFFWCFCISVSVTYCIRKARQQEQGNALLKKDDKHKTLVIKMSET